MARQELSNWISSPRGPLLIWVEGHVVSLSRLQEIELEDRLMLGPFRIEAYAIASADGMIADETGKYPKSLRFDADQLYLRESLDRAAVIVQGRNSGTGQPNWRERLRLIMTRKVASLAPHPDNPNARFWNPAGASLEEACLAVGCARGTVAVIGGPEVYSYFLQIGYDDFYLSRAENVYLPGGKPLFAQGQLGQKPEEVLAAAGLRPGPTRRTRGWSVAGRLEASGLKGGEPTRSTADFRLEPGDHVPRRALPLYTNDANSLHPVRPP